ncbi:serine/threonine-protein kinase-like protein At5g23170 [Pistacia vera]|uniref:serine/threonine-protein kinase-like protein At5g23170 n=1 Tax=Pistacia vera TaxID=55513 RepID=UPI0012637ECC|nr:serine/threonine-protein kinase-like protein At5g23170 [Pistacia vera]XP_031273928.1 serine/threonine-protein kinase-like protein At5g23170 [Pistacia vera]
MEFDYQELVKATQSFSHSSLIGKGSHGSVYKAILEDDHNVFAVKRASFNGHEVFHDNSKKLKNEIQVLSSLRDRENPNVVNFLGTSTDCEHQNKLLVMEFLPNGSLHDLLHNSSSSSPLPSWPKRVEIAIQIAKAIHFLHEVANPVIIHRDIKSSNILFDSNWSPKLVDFGLAVNESSITSQPIQPAGTIGYLDPSYTSPKKLSTKTDMFSFGVVLLEIISCRKAIDVSKQPASIVEWATALIKEKQAMAICDTSVSMPSYMEGTIKHMLNLAARCVSLEEENRPEIGEVFMAEKCFVERVRTIPAWMSLWGSVTRMKRRQRRSDMPSKKLICDRDNENGDNICSDITRGKMILREILADIALK